ncbi:hypothetical protein [Wukongibacter sp. M2B1]
MKGIVVVSFVAERKCYTIDRFYCKEDEKEFVDKILAKEKVDCIYR